MEKGGQQLRYSSGLINNVALKSESKIGYCEMYRNNNSCLCMMAQDKNGKFSALPECKGMCTKQNINIYIENYETRTNNEKYEPTNIETYPYYKVKSEGKISAINNVFIGRNQSTTKSMCADMLWRESLSKADNMRNWEPSNNIPNVTYYPLLNNSHQCITEDTPFVHKQIENKSNINHVQLNISTEVDNSLLYKEINKNYTYEANAQKDKILLNTAPEATSSLIVSGAVPSTSCNNLYVAPPFFTVDKFANVEQGDTRQRNTHDSSFHSQHKYSNHREPPNISFQYNSTKNHTLQMGDKRIINNEEQLIGIQFVNESNIPLVRLETSIEPIDIGNHLPINSKMESYRSGGNINVNIPYTNAANKRSSFIRNTNDPISFSIDHYNSTDPIEMDDHLCEYADLSGTYGTSRHSKHNIAVHNIQCKQYQHNPPRDVYEKQNYSNIVPTHPHAKTLIRETRKPNYRELINHVHAQRSSLSENDLNMQIIKRTLSYNHLPRDVPHTVLSRKLFTKTSRRNVDNTYSTTQEANESKIIRPPESQHLFSGPANIVSPLDLSVKTIKTNADSTESNNNTNKTFVTENGYPPKFHFMPNFSESLPPKPIADTINNESTEIISKASNRGTPLKSNAPLNMASHSNYFYPSEQNLKIEGGSRLGTELTLEKTVSKIEVNIAGGLQNDIRPHILKSCESQDNEERTAIKLEVTLKRSIPLNSEDDNKLLKKKICLDSLCNSASKTCSVADQYSEKSTTDLKGVNNSEVVLESISIEKPISNIKELSSSKNKQNTSVAKSDILAKPNLILNDTTRITAETKPDVSSIIAARIRTKAELKGFIFQEEKDVYNEKPVSNKENFHCNYSIQSLVPMNEVDLSEWQNTCNGFVDQLINNFKGIKFEKKVFKLREIENDHSLVPQSSKTDLKDDASNSFGQSSEHIIDFKQLNDKAIDDNLKNMLNFQVKLTENNSDSEKNVVLKIEDSIKLEPIENCDENNSLMCTKEGDLKVENTTVNNIDTTKICNQSTKICKEINIDSIKNEDLKQIKKNVEAIDLTKISVVRLKRENYSKRYSAICNNSVNIKESDEHDFIPSKKHSAKQGKIKTMQAVNDVLENAELKFDTITTRLQHQRLQLENNVNARVKNNISTIQKKKRFHRQKTSDRELLNDPDKIFLEVYRYKRALKVPPNLITIRNPYVQRMSASLPDLELQRNSLKNESIHSDCVAESVPKSIIDVLHSRVVKSKGNHKIYKNEHKLKSKLAIKQRKNAELSFGTLSSCDNNKLPNREHHNVFETQVLTSRTRREYKMQLNKQVIREIFGDSDRPASAPPEINNDYDSNCFQKLNSINETFFGNKIDYEEKIIHESKSLLNDNSKEQTPSNDKSIISTKCKRKRNGRPYRRKYSSGFDYLRKRKKRNTHTLFNYTHLKTKAENYMKEANLKFKNENDVSREIQKWVLNKGVGQSALHKAARLGYIDVIVYCLEKMGLNPDHKDNAGYTPLHDACVNGSLEIARVLLQYGANHSEGAHSGIRPLHEASENGHIEIVRMLLSYGADPLLETYSGQTPLMLATDIEMNDLISMHLLDVKEHCRKNWRFPGPWKLFDDSEIGFDTFKFMQDKTRNFLSNSNGTLTSQNQSLKNDVCEYEIFVDAADAEGELFEFEEANMPLPPLYLLKDEGMEKWVLLNDLCSLLKVKSKDTLLNKIFPSISPATVSRSFTRELKMGEFLEKATCLQLLCAGEKINICHSKVVLIQYNENVRKLLGVKTILMKF